MRCLGTDLLRTLSALAIGIALSPFVQAAQPLPLIPPEGRIQLVNGRMVLKQEPEDTRQPEATRQPELSSGGLGSANAGINDGGFLAMAAADPDRIFTTPAGAPSETLAPATQAMPSVDLGGALQQSDSVQSMNTQLRNLASLDPRIRGYRYGQIYTQADGAYWIPVRQDLDTPLSMIDPSVVQTVEVVPGPYSLQYGPGLSFLNILTTSTPRYDSFEAHAYVGNNYFANGNLLNATQRIYGGNKDWGFSILHGTRDGNHYTSGNGSTIPSRYNNEDFFAQFGFDLDTDSHAEFRYLRQDQTDTQYPGQLFKTNIAITEGFTAQWIDETPGAAWNKLVTEGWYNIGHLKGGTDPGEHIFDIVQRIDQALENLGIVDPNFNATTNASTISTGGRVASVFGEDGFNQLTIGTDFRYVNQYVNENLQFSDSGSVTNFSTGLPRSYMVDPGAFAEYNMPLSPYWTTTIGSRVDWLHTDIVQPFPNYTTNPGLPFSQNNILYAFFLTNKVELDDTWSARFGFGQAQRPPTMTERYASGEFLTLLQSGLSRVVGKSTLTPERAWQLDGSLNCSTENFRARLNGYFSFINNFSTFYTLPVIDPTGARLLFTETTNLATLAGFEGSTERDLNSYWTSFTSILYVSGRDQTLGAPLTQIYPLEGRVGLRLHDPDGGNRWGTEMFARIVDRQDRLGTLRNGLTGDRVIVELPTGGFTVWNLRAYYNASEKINYVAGINNMFDRNYIEHLSIRYAPSPGFPGLGVLSPGFTPYIGINMTY